jgi:cysteine desulfurase
VVRKGYHLEPIIFGGGHQKGMRSGTLNVPGIVGLGEACRLRSLEMEEDEKRIATMRDRLQALLLAKIPNLISIPSIPNSAIIARVRAKLAISTGSACSSGVEVPSHVLREMKLPDNVIEGALRIGIGKFTTDAEIDQAAETLAIAIKQIMQALHK